MWFLGKLTLHMTVEMRGLDNRAMPPLFDKCFILGLHVKNCGPPTPGWNVKSTFCMSASLTFEVVPNFSLCIQNNNPIKCNMMTLSRKKKNITFNYTLENTPLGTLNKIKYLEVAISNNLNWSDHISYICNKANRTLGLVKRNLKDCQQTLG